MSRQFLCVPVALAVFVPAISIRADALDHWTSTQLSTNSFGLNLLVYGNGRYVAAGGKSDGGALMSSEDGLSWILRADGGCCGPPSLVYGLTYGGGRFVAVGHFGGTASSSDGINWSFANVQSGALNDVAYGAGIYAAVGSADYFYFDNIFSSVDGFTWTARHSDPTEQRSISGVAYGAGKFVAIGANDGFTYTSSTGTNWTRRSIP